jgi:hypothetical protein
MNVILYFMDRLGFLDIVQTAIQIIIVFILLMVIVRRS